MQMAKALLRKETSLSVVADTHDRNWRTFKVPGDNPHTYAVYVDERDHAWVSEGTGNAMYRFDPATEKFERFAFPRPCRARGPSARGPLHPAAGGGRRG